MRIKKIMETPGFHTLKYSDVDSFVKPEDWTCGGGRELELEVDWTSDWKREQATLHLPVKPPGVDAPCWIFREQGATREEALLKVLFSVAAHLCTATIRNDEEDRLS